MESLFQSATLTVERFPVFQYKFPPISVKSTKPSAIQTTEDGKKFALFDFVPAADTIQGIDVESSTAFVCTKLAVLGALHSEATPSNYVDGEMVVLFTTESDKKRFAMLICPLKYNVSATETPLDSLLKLKEGLSMNFDMQSVLPGGGARKPGSEGNCFAYTLSSPNGDRTDVFYLKERLFVKTNLSGFATSTPSPSFPAGITASGSNATNYSEASVLTMGLTNGDIFMDCNPVDATGSTVDVAMGYTSKVAGKVSRDIANAQYSNTLFIIIVSSIFLLAIYTLGHKLLAYLQSKMGVSTDVQQAAATALNLGSMGSVLQNKMFQFGAGASCVAFFSWGIYANSPALLTAGLLTLYITMFLMMMKKES